MYIYIVKALFMKIYCVKCKRNFASLNIVLLKVKMVENLIFIH